jgi:hypothetical protein
MSPTTRVPPAGPAPHPAANQAGTAPVSVVDAGFGSTWPDSGTPARRDVLLGCAAVGLFAGLSLPEAGPGLATTLMLLAAGALVLRVSRHRRSPFTWACAALAVGFAVMVTVRDAEWIVVLGLLLSALLTTAALVNARSALAMALGAISWPMSGLRGLPWLGRTFRALGGGNNSAAVIRTALLSALAVLVFGVLFATGDAIVGHWLGLVLPDLEDEVVLRTFVTVAVTGVVLAAAYLAMNPPPLDRPATRRPAQHRFEWLAPVLLVDAVFALFLAAQAAAFIGGHDYVREATGLTYAEYVHQGFGQLTFATALMLLVVWAASRKAGDSLSDQWWLRGSLGVLCVLTLVVVASALHRMDLYQEAYGFTRLRLLVDVFEGWLGLVVLAVMVAGIRLRGWWLPRMALLTGAALLLGLAVVSPDAWIARHNLDRYEATGKVDWDYLRGLSADAVPTLAALPPEQAACALDGDVPDEGGWTAWNLGRARAAEALEDFEPPRGVVCNEDVSTRE